MKALGNMNDSFISIQVINSNKKILLKAAILKITAIVYLFFTRMPCFLETVVLVDYLFHKSEIFNVQLHKIY